MKKIVEFNDFLFNFLFENKKEVVIIISDRLKDVLKKINHPVSDSLLGLMKDATYSDKVAYIDYDDEKIGNFTYIIPNKIEKITQIEDVYNHDLYYYNILPSSYNRAQLWTDKQRPSVGLGKVINKIFPGKYSTPKKEEGVDGKVRNYLEEFTNLFIAERQKMKDIFKNIKIVDGSDIIKYYNEHSYDYTIGKSTLYDSCMKKDKCSNFLEFYSDNNGVKLVVLMSDKEKDKIIGRALLWDIAKIDGEDVDRKFMDRIYSVHDSYVNIFKDYAKQKGWLYKYKQNMDENEYIYDTKKDTLEQHTLVTKDGFEETHYYPYLDTLKYYYYDDDGFLTNQEEFGHVYSYLSDTDGGPNNFYSDDENYNEDEEVYVPFYDHYFTQSYIDDNMVQSERMNSYIENRDSVETYYYNGYSDYIPESESTEVFMEKAASYSKEQAIDSAERTHVLDDDLHDDGFIAYNMDGEWYYFHPNDSKYFLLCESLENRNAVVYAHKEWDKDKIFKWDGKYFLNDAKDQKKYDDLVGQIRMFDNKNNDIK